MKEIKKLEALLEKQFDALAKEFEDEHNIKIAHIECFFFGTDSDKKSDVTIQIA